MGTVSMDIDRPLDFVWSGVLDAARYPEWLSGAQQVEVPASWPTTGATFDHRVGVGPFRIPGSTTVRENERRDRFRLGAGIGPFGEADVTFEFEALGLVGTRIRMSEAPSGGLMAVAGRIARPLVDRIVDGRNIASLRRLRDLLVS
jgi:carbon monoxide dehydrogenase subunit G